MTNTKPAGFRLRVLAWVLETALWSVLYALVAYMIFSSSTNLVSFVNNLLIILVIAVPFIYFAGGILYPSYFNSRYGGQIGKLLTGLQVLGDNRKFLTFRRSLFRHTVGYSFSSVLFGLGFLAIIKDKEKKAWHDQATGSQVVVKNNLWVASLILLLVLAAANWFLWTSAVDSLAPQVKSEFSTFINNLKQQSVKKDPYAKRYDYCHFFLTEKGFKDIPQDIQEACFQLPSLAKSDSEKGDAYSLLGEIQYTLGNKDQAYDNAIKAIEYSPKDLYSLQTIVLIDTEKQDLELAESRALKLLEYYPDDAYGHFLLGQVYYNQYKDKEAIKELKKAIELDPGHTKYKEILTSWEKGE